MGFLGDIGKFFVGTFTGPLAHPKETLISVGIGAAVGGEIGAGVAFGAQSLKGGISALHHSATPAAALVGPQTTGNVISTDQFRNTPLTTGGFQPWQTGFSTEGFSPLTDSETLLSDLGIPSWAAFSPMELRPAQRLEFQAELLGARSPGFYG